MKGEWYQTEQKIKNDSDIEIPINNEEIETVRKDTNGTVKEDCLKVIGINRKIPGHAIRTAALSKLHFNVVENRFSTNSIEESLERNDY